jgi:DNA repair protein RadC
MHPQRAELPLKLDGLTAAREFFSGCLPDADPKRESLWVAHVDDQLRCIHLTRHPGDETGAVFPLRDIVAEAAEHCSNGVVLAHNHPSGDPRLSESDWRATRRLATVAEAMDCTVLDHLIFAGDEYPSFRKLGLL